MTEAIVRGRLVKVRLAAVTTSRSDFGSIQPVVRAALRDPRFEARLMVCGQHLRANTPSPEELRGLPATRIESSDSALDGISQKALGAALSNSGCDVAFLIGDRFELLSVAETCTIHHIPLAHGSGGERTLGAFDDQVRDAISKLAHLHCVAHEPARARLIALQEEPWRIEVTGDPGLDAMLGEDGGLDPDELAAIVGVKPTRSDLVIAFHPVTRSAEETARGIVVLSEIAREHHGNIFLSAPNGDPGSERIEAAWKELAYKHPHCRVLCSLGARVFRSLVQATGGLAGNSSAGIWETPSLRAPSLDVGTRQRGRIRGASVLSCPEFNLEMVRSAVRRLLSDDMRMTAERAENPYGDGAAALRILNHIWAGMQRPCLSTKDGDPAGYAVAD